MLENAKFDVLLILDCCHAAGAVTKGTTGTMEVLAGCGRETTARGPGGGSVIGSPFTYSLTSIPEKEASRPSGLLMVELQTLLSTDKVLKDQSPIHVVISGHVNPIKLRPIGSTAEQQLTDDPNLSAAEPELKALLAISFRGQVMPEVEEFVNWLTSQYPKEISHIELERVGIEGSFDSCSTLVLLSMPISTWAYLKELSGSLFVGFVKSRNLSFDKYQTTIAVRTFLERSVCFVAY
jgi:hypothetical protein